MYDKQANWKARVAQLYRKHEQLVRYVIVGGLTTVISYGAQAFFSQVLKWHVTVNTILAFIPAVTFAYFANKHFVFHSQTDGAADVTREAGSFFALRLVSLAIEAALMTLVVKVFHVPELIAKLPVNFVIILTNYVFSKVFIFKNKTNERKEEMSE